MGFNILPRGSENVFSALFWCLYDYAWFMQHRNYAGNTFSEPCGKKVNTLKNTSVQQHAN